MPWRFFACPKTKRRKTQSTKPIFPHFLWAITWWIVLGFISLKCRQKCFWNRVKELREMICSCYFCFLSLLFYKALLDCCTIRKKHTHHTLVCVYVCVCDYAIVRGKKKICPWCLVVCAVCACICQIFLHLYTFRSSVLLWCSWHSKAWTLFGIVTAELQSKVWMPNKMRELRIDTSFPDLSPLKQDLQLLFFPLSRLIPHPLQARVVMIQKRTHENKTDKTNSASQINYKDGGLAPSHVYCSDWALKKQNVNFVRQLIQCL